MARMRKKKNIEMRMEACKRYWFSVPVMNRGHWREACEMPPDAPVYLELGCGKGRFSIEMAKRNPDVCYIALEKDESVILAAIEEAAKSGMTNLFFLNADAFQLRNYFGEGEVSRIFINFCDPWSKKNKPKRRLTYRVYLEMYKELLSADGQIHFKTDNERLFAFSQDEFRAANLALSCQTEDLHHSVWDADNIRTEFEQKFAEQGFRIFRVEAHKIV